MQTWVPTQCKVHGVWLEQHWRTVSNRRRLDEHDGSLESAVGERPLKDEGVTSRISKSSRRRSFSTVSYRNEDYWQYHFEVSVPSRPGWQHADACYTDSCRASEYNLEDDAAYWLNELLDGACEDAGYDFDSGITDFDDTDRTNRALERGINCAAAQGTGPPPPTGPAPGPAPYGTPSTYGPPPPAPGPDPYGMPAYGPPPPSPPGAQYPPPPSPPVGPAGQYPQVQYPPGAQYPPGGQYSVGAAVGGGAFRNAQPPCQCKTTYPCMYLKRSGDSGVMPRVKMSMDPHDPTWYLWLGLLPCICCMCCSCVAVCGQVLGIGPMSAGAKFNRLY